jgi:thioredoxin-like negative regulator of GroEL
MWLLFFFIISHCLLTHAKVINVTDEKVFTNLTQKNDKKIIVEFSANWCSACTQVKKPFEEVATEEEFETITFLCVDVEQSPALCKKYCSDGIPTFVYFDCGEQKDKEIGVKDMHIFKDHLRNSLRKNFISTKQQSLPRVTLLSPDDNLSIQKNNHGTYTDILNSVNNTIFSFITTIKEWVGC